MGIVEESVLRKNGEEMSQTGTLDNAWILIDVSVAYKVATDMCF